jgi:hypothetical protein
MVGQLIKVITLGSRMKPSVEAMDTYPASTVPSFLPGSDQMICLIVHQVFMINPIDIQPNYKGQKLSSFFPPRSSLSLLFLLLQPYSL